jgi:hypothetical protein
MLRPAAVAIACVAAAAAGTVALVISLDGSPQATNAADGAPSGQVAVPGAQGNASLNDASAHPASFSRTPVAGPAPSSVTRQGIAKAVVALPAAHRGAVSVWAAGPGGRALTSLTSQLSAVTQLGGVGLYTTMKQECSTLAIDVASARAAVPIPDAGMQAAYGRALSQLGSAASTCRSAIQSWPEGNEDIQTHVSQPLLRNALASLAAGAHQLYLGTQQIRMLHQRPAA